MSKHSKDRCDKKQSCRPVGAIFSATNPGVVNQETVPSDNEIFMFRRFGCGSLQEIDRERTGGIGTGPGTTFPVDPLGSQGSITTSDEGKFLFVVNAGASGATGVTGTVSSMRIYKDKIKQVDTVSSGGVFPVSCTSHKDLLYVLNAGDATNVTGFRIKKDGKLDQIFVSAAGPTGTFGNYSMVNGQPTPFVSFLQNPTQVSFSPDGTKLVVSVKEYQGGANGPRGALYVFSVLPNGELDLTSMVKNNSSGFLPWGFVFYNDYLIVTEIIGQGDPTLDPTGKSAISTYKLNNDNTLTPISISVPSGQTSICWISRAGKFVYSSNTGSNTISKYRIHSDGHISLRNATEFTTNNNPLDNIVLNDKYLCVLCAGEGSIQVLKIDEDNGHLKLTQTLKPFDPLAGAMGLAAVNFK